MICDGQDWLWLMIFDGQYWLWLMIHDGQDWFVVVSAYTDTY